MSRYLAAVLLLLLIACTERSSVPVSQASDATERGESSGDAHRGSNDDSSRGGSNESTTTKGTTDPAPAPVACTNKTGSAGDTNITMSSGGRDREAILHAPPQYQATKPMPLVLVLHPLLLDHLKMREIARVERFSDAGDGFLALFPNGIDKSWNAGECCGTAKDEKVEDVRFIKELLAKVSETHCVDTTRIYSMGFSNGGFLSHRLACDLGDTIRAIAPVAGTLGIPEADCARTTPLPVFAIHGTDDELVPYEGGPPKALHGIFESFGTFQAPTATDAFWAKHNGLPETTVQGFEQGEVSCKRHDGKAPVTLCTVEGGGHQWPGSDSLLLLATMGHMTKDIDATAAAVAFFHEQGL